MKRFWVYVWIVFLSVSGLHLAAQTLDEILAKNYQAHGGLDKLKAFKSMKATGKIVMPAQGLEMSMTIWGKTPNKMRMEAIFQSQTIVEAFDGDKAWQIMPFMGINEPQELTGDQAQTFKEQADFESPLVVYKERGYKLELLGKEDMQGTPVFKLRLTKKDGKETFLYLDAESGIELKTATTLQVSGADVQVETINGDYKPVNGLMMPFYMETKINGQTQMQMTFDNYELNPAIEESFFKLPAKKEEVKPAEIKK